MEHVSFSTLESYCFEPFGQIATTSDVGVRISCLCIAFFFGFCTDNNGGVGCIEIQLYQKCDIQLTNQLHWSVMYDRRERRSLILVLIDAPARLPHAT